MNRREFLVAAAALPVSLTSTRVATAGGIPDPPFALVTADLDAHVCAVDLVGGRVLARIPTQWGPRSIESVAGRTALVAHTDIGRISLLDARSLSVRKVVGGFHRPRYTAAHPSHALAYVTDSASEEVVTLDVGPGRIVSRTSLPGPARHVSVSPDGRTLWTALGSKAERVAVLDLRDPRRPKLERTLSPPFLAHDVVFAPRGRHVWVTSGAGHRVALYRSDTRQIVRIVDADRAPQHVVFGGDRVFVSSGDDGTVRIHRLNGDLVRQAEVPVGSYNVTFGDGRVVTPSLSRGTVALLDDRGRVLTVRTTARAAHDACVVSGL